MALTSLSPQRITELIAEAERRITLMAPGIHLPVAKALAEALTRLGPEAVNIIVDTSPDVFRLGYGTLEALEFVNAAAQELGTLVCHQKGVQVCVLVADDIVAIYAPRPLLVSESDVEAGESNGVLLGPGHDPADIKEQLGVAASVLGREFGLDGLSNSRMADLKQELENNPPQKFELARTVRVFNARFEFVELEIKGLQVSRKEVTLPGDLIAVRSDEVRRKLKTSYRLIDESDTISKAQREVEELRREIEKRFLRVIPGFGMAVLRSDRDLFDAALTDLQQCVYLFRSVVESEMARAVEVSINQIADALAPAIEAAPTVEFHRWAKWRPEATALEFVKDRLYHSFHVGANSLPQIVVNVAFKGVTYESLMNERFLMAAKKAFPELQELFNEFSAAASLPPR